MRPLLRTVLSVLSTATVWTLLVLPYPAAAQTPGVDGIKELNRHRHAAGVAPVTLSPGGAAQLHAQYLALNKDKPEVAGLRSHEQVAGLPGYTPEGAAAAARSNIAQGQANVEIAITGLVDVPFHRHGMLDPTLGAVGLGGQDGQWVADLSDSKAVRGAPLVVAYPGPGQTNVPRVFPGGEVPNPLAAIPGLALDATVGYAITLHFYGCMPEGTQASLTVGGQPVPIHLIQPGTVVKAEGGEREARFVMFFPQAPLRPDTTYLAQVVTACGTLEERTYTWPFTTRSAFKSEDTQSAVSAPDAAGQQTVTVQFVDTTGRPLSAVRVKGARWSYSSNRPLVTAPKLSLGAPSGADGRMTMNFALNDANTAEVQLDVEYDGAVATIPLKVARNASGQLRQLAPASAAPMDMVARAAWEAGNGPLLPLTMTQPSERASES
ncbi:MAG TPA: CAP domain-containing protein [Chloroflexota bacterium]|nr:CAP domain-containing protein [Chloroflexota bacterium]